MIFIIDWGEGAQGGRYALIDSVSLDAAWLDADAIGCPFKIAPFKIPRDEGWEMNYMEIGEVEAPFAGPFIHSSFDWKTSAETFAL